MNIIIEKGLWETDFLINDILPKGNVIYITTDNIENVNNNVDIYAFSSRVHCFWHIKDVVQKISPKIIICLSDEFYQENKWEYNLLGNYCKLFLRNYHHQYYNYTNNTIHLPLGYTNGCKKIVNNKVYNWSFIGQMKSDRYEMLECFSKINDYYINNNLDKTKMCEIYSKSIFVPCGRGNSSLECFRLYEASMNNAIPVVVGDLNEIKTTFKYQENPPWVFAESWESAVDICKSLLNNKDQLTKMQENLSIWWYNRILNIRNKVKEVL